MKTMQDDIENKNLLTIGDASEYLGISIDTLRRWEKKGRIEPLRSPGGHRYYKKDDLDNLFGKKYVREEQTVRKQGPYNDRSFDSNISKAPYNRAPQNPLPSDNHYPNTAPMNSPFTPGSTLHYPSVTPSHAPLQQPFTDPSMVQNNNTYTQNEQIPQTQNLSQDSRSQFRGYPIDQFHRENDQQLEESQTKETFTNFPFFERPPREVKIPERETVQVVKEDVLLTPQEAYFRQQSMSVLTPPEISEPVREERREPPENFQREAPREYPTMPAPAKPAPAPTYQVRPHNGGNSENITIDKKLLIYGGIGLGVLFLFFAWYAVYISSQRVLSPIP